MIRSSEAMPQEFNASRALVWKTSDLKQVSLWWRRKTVSGSERGVPAARIEMMTTFGKEGRAQVTMRMVFVSGQTAGDEEETEDAWRTTA
jgi:hypothetical protein